MTQRSLLVLAALLVGCDKAVEEDPTADCIVIDTAELSTGGTLTAGCYLLNEDLDIDGDVVLEDGVEVFVAAGMWIEVRTSGSLDVQGNEVGVVLQGQSDDVDSWFGLFVDGEMTFNKLTVIGGGDTSYGGVHAGVHLTGGSITGTDLWIEQSTEYGFYAHSATAPVVIEGLAIYGAATPALLGLQQGTGLSGALEMDGGVVLLEDGDLASDGVLPALDFASFRYDWNIDAALTLSPGLTLTMHEDSRFDVDETGQLLSMGTETEGVVIQGAQALPGFWKGLTIRNGGAIVSELYYTKISDAGDRDGTPDYSYGALELDEGEAILSGVTLSGNAGFALSIESEVSGGIVVENCVFTDNERSIVTSAPAAGVFDDTNVFSGNDETMIVVAERYPYVKTESTWSVTNVPYFVREDLDIEDSLGIMPGARLIFEEHAGLDIFGTGLLTVGDTAGDPVVMEGSRNQVALWKGIRFNNNSDSNLLANVTFKDAGSGWNSAGRSESTLYLEDSNLSLDSVTVLDSGLHDLWADGESTVSCTNVTMTMDGSDEASICEP